VTTGFSGTEAALTLNAREQRILSRISDELAKTAPALVSFLHFFNRLASDEEMPPRRPLRRLRRRLSSTALTWMFVSAWTFVTAGMLSCALILTYTGQANAATSQGSCPSASSILVPCGQAKAPPVPPKG
jgi:hypothetical protein